MTILSTVSSCVGVDGIGDTAPFDVPQTGRSEELMGSVKLQLAPTAMAFDSLNRPYLINNRNPEKFGTLLTLRNGTWVTCSFAALFTKDEVPKKRAMHANGELVIDDADCLYATVGGKLVYSPDQGKTFKAYPCKGSLELRTGPGKLTLPPAICRITNSRYVDRQKKRQPGMAWWAKRGTFSVVLPKKTNDGLNLGEPITISENCLAAGSGGHSGGTSFAATTGDLTHVVYAEVPKDPRTGGNPIFIATIDRRTRKVVSKEFLVNASPKVADVHTRPTIAADGKGYLHVLSGSHGQPFHYLRSKMPGDISSGWTKPATLSGRQCYASIVCDGDDRLHSVFREWIPHASLGYSSALASDGKWGKPTTLVHGANPRGKYKYGIFYHRLFIDRRSTLYLSFTFFEFTTNDKGDYPEVLIVSKDGGKTWSLAADLSLKTGVR